MIGFQLIDQSDAPAFLTHIQQYTPAFFLNPAQSFRQLLATVTTIAHKEPILIHGDYDTDGITASALLALVLRQNGGIVHSFIPHRFDDGYGFTPESLQKALDTFGPCKVLVTVDCGITSCDAVNDAVERGIDVIVTDHHEAGSELPKALAVINPKVYPELEDLQLLSGAGAAFNDFMALSGKISR